MKTPQEENILQYEYGLYRSVPTEIFFNTPKKSETTRKQADESVEGR